MSATSSNSVVDATHTSTDRPKGGVSDRPRRDPGFSSVRTTYIDETTRADGTSRTTPRMVTLVWSYNDDTGEVRYGASVFRDSGDPRDTFCRRDHRHTATQRYLRYPVRFFLSRQNSAPISVEGSSHKFNYHFDYVLQSIRQEMYESRCQNKPGKGVNAQHKSDCSSGSSSRRSSWRRGN
jgi:hypothetical protein